MSWSEAVRGQNDVISHLLLAEIILKTPPSIQNWILMGVSEVKLFDLSPSWPVKPTFIANKYSKSPQYQLCPQQGWVCWGRWRGWWAGGRHRLANSHDPPQQVDPGPDGQVRELAPLAGPGLGSSWLVSGCMFCLESSSISAAALRKPHGVLAVSEQTLHWNLG